MARLNEKQLIVGDLYSYSVEKSICNDWFFTAKKRIEHFGCLKSNQPFVILEKQKISLDSVYLKILSSDGIIGWLVVEFYGIKKL